MDPAFNLFKIHNMLVKKLFRSDEAYTEFHIEICMKDATSKNTLKRVFSIMHLSECLEKKFTL